MRLGPLLRFVDETSATVWVETDGDARVTVRAGEGDAAVSAQRRTFVAHGHHYALVDLDGLRPGTRTPYVVEVDGQQVWPPRDSSFPPPVVQTLEVGRPLRMLYGSCRVSVSHDEAGNAAHGIDAMRAYALDLAGRAGEAGDVGSAGEWPDLVLFLGDQVYADETSDEMKAFIEGRRDPAESPGWELQDYEEYAHLYRLAWSDPANRWLLSTVPSAMIFDDHDIRDDWNTSASWRARLEATDWWHDRVVGGLASYWVYQHLGNLSPAERLEDDLWRRVATYDGSVELDVTEALDALADRADQRPESYRWSFSRDFGTQARLVVVDSRAARVLTPERRSMLDDDEMAWLDARMTGGFDHLLVGTSLPFLLSPGLHHLEALSEAVAQGRLGRFLAPLGEVARQGADLEHWAAFQDAFQRVGRMVVEVAAGERGPAPRTVTFLSGDVHHSYVALATPDPASGLTARSAIVQAVCSPIRNPLPAVMRWAMSTASHGSARPTGRLLGGRVPRSPLRWRLTKGPWYDNNLALLEVREHDLHLSWSRGVADGSPERPRLEQVATLDVPYPV